MSTTNIVKNDLSVILNKSAKEIENMYFAELLCASILLRHGDGVTENMLTDRHGKMLKSYSKTMSQVNALGFVVNNPKNVHSKEYMSKSVIQNLDTDSGRILNTTFRELHREISSPKDGCDFAVISEALRIISLRFELRTKKLNHIRFVIENWLFISATEKSQAVNSLFTFMYKYNKNSTLFSRLRIASAEILLQANKKSDNVVKFDRLNEEEASVSTITSSVNIASVEKRIFKGKTIRRRIRKWFPQPDFLKQKEDKK